MKPSIAWALVGAQFGLLAGLFVLPSGELWPRGLVTLVVGGIMVAAGVAIVAIAGLGLGQALTPVPIPKEGAPLITKGIYRYVRHPIYSGVVLAALGLVIIGASAGHIVGWIALYVVLSIKASGEESMLTERHPDYAAYASSTGRLLPKLFYPKSSH
jgi:protein-S-isoprenylcysteine O-methyltransferase Ste14